MTTIQLSGGLKSTFRKAIQLYHLEGISCIKRGFGIAANSGPVLRSVGSDAFDRNDYTEWVRRYDTFADEIRNRIRKCIDNMPDKPLISVVMPTYNPDPERLREAIESVRSQIYQNWELCIADDASTDTRIRPILKQVVHEDARIKVVFSEQNGHVSAASNSAASLTTGEWVTLLDHDDLLPEHALFWVADAINRNPDAALIYSDEDKIDEHGQRRDPYFKPDWNLYLFRSHNVINRLGVYKKSLLDGVGGFRVGFEGSQDYDLALRCTQRLTTEQIVHIPRVLYHWRIHRGSSANFESNAKPCAYVAGERAINESLVRMGIAGRAEALIKQTSYRVHYELPVPSPLVSLIVPTRNGRALVRRCIESILNKTSYTNYEILLVDNGSDEPESLAYFDELRKHPAIRVLRDDRPFNYSALNNAAVKQARGDLVGLVNDDIEVITPEWLGEMVSLAMQPGAGAVGARLWYPDNRLQHGGVILGVGGVAGHSHKHLPMGRYGYYGRASLIQGLSAVTAACLVIRKGIFESVGGLDAQNLRVAYNDVDFCLRVREAGYQNIWTPYAELYHHESATRGHEDTPERKLRFSEEVLFMKKKWGDKLLNDPAYSPNLTLDHKDFSYAWPPRVELLRAEESSLCSYP